MSLTLAQSSTPARAGRTVGLHRDRTRYGVWLCWGPCELCGGGTECAGLPAQHGTAHAQFRWPHPSRPHLNSLMLELLLCVCCCRCCPGSLGRRERAATGPEQGTPGEQLRVL